MLMKKYSKQQGSITLGIVFGLGMLGLSIAATTIMLSTNAIANNSNAASGIRSLVTTDAAVREGFYRALKTYSYTTKTIDFTSTDMSSTAIANTNGMNAATVNVTEISWPIYEIQSASTNNKTTRQIVATLDVFPSAFAFDQAVYTHGALEISGNTQISGSVYATDGIDFTGGAAEVDGNAYSPATINTLDDDNVQGDIVTNHPQINPPTIDLTPYQNQAITDGTYYASGFGPNAEIAIKNQTNHNKIFYVADNVSITGGADFTGMLIVEGNLSLSQGAFSVGDTAPYDEPLVVYVMGDLTLSGNVEINGIVCVEGITTFGAGTPKINGSLISMDDNNTLTVNGNINITYDPAYGTAWQDITGLDTNSGSSPVVKDWHEE